MATDIDFPSSCRQLAERATADGFAPDVLIGIATGGDFVAEAMNRSLRCPHVMSIRLQRPSTGAKQHVGGILRRLPRPVADLLRRAERRVGIIRDALFTPSIPRVKLPEATVDRLLALDIRRILLVDDAVDSGRTLLAVKTALAALLPDAEIRTAAITMTRPKTLIRPDFNLYTEIVRFPWSLDAQTES